MSKLSVALFVATLGLACAAMFADAQTAQKPKPPASAEKPAPAAPACGACPQCPCEMAADKGGMMQGGGMMMQHSKHEDRHSRHRELATLADIKVQTTKLGATIQLIAKNPADAARVQELAKDVAAFLSEPAGHAHPGSKP